MAKMIVQHKENTGNWTDLKRCTNQKEAKNYIEANIGEFQVDRLRIVMLVAHCKTEVVFVDDIDAEELNENAESREIKSEKNKPEKIITVDTKDLYKEKKTSEKKTTPKANTAPQNYTEHDLKLLYFKRSCELKRWAKTVDFENIDRSRYPAWNTFRYHIGSLGNVMDMVICDLKKDPISIKYQEIIDEYFGEKHTGTYVAKKLTDRRK